MRCRHLDDSYRLLFLIFFGVGFFFFFSGELPSFLLVLRFDELPRSVDLTFLGAFLGLDTGLEGLDLSPPLSRLIFSAFDRTRAFLRILNISSGIPSGRSTVL